MNISTFTVLTLACTLVQAVAEEPAPGVEKVGNPVFPGWYADPEAIIIGDEYWIYPTFSAPYDKQLHLDAFSSQDLVHWTKHERILDNTIVLAAPRPVGAGDRGEGREVLPVLRGQRRARRARSAASAWRWRTRPAGPYKDLLGKPLIGEIHNGAQPIDQFVFLDKDGQYYMIYGGWSHCNIAKFKEDFTGFVPFDDGTVFKEITPQGLCRRPDHVPPGRKLLLHVVRRRLGRPALLRGLRHRRFTPGSVQAHRQGPAAGPGRGHRRRPPLGDSRQGGGHLVCGISPPSADARPIGNHRVTCMDRMYFDEKGFIKPIKITKEGEKKRTLADSVTRERRLPVW